MYAHEPDFSFCKQKKEMENLYGFHYTDDHCYSEEQSSMAPPPLPPSSNSVVSSMGTPILVPAGSSAPDNAFLQQEQEQEQDDDEEVSKVLRAKVVSHPLFPQLLNNYIDCRKVGAPPEMAQLLDEIREPNIGASAFLGSDLELDNFMGTYCNLLAKYKYELLRPFEEATMFLNDMETQLNSLICNGPALIDEATAGSSEKGFITDEKETIECKRINEDRELKDNLLRRYSGYISTLKNEFSKNKKKERLPNEAKQILLAWWNINFKWPYPTDADKVALAEWTGLDQKQINNWFINQRKRHWKLPSDQEMQAAVLDGIYGPICMSESE